MKTNSSNPTEPPNSAPVHFANCGRVSASVWEHDINGRVEYKVVVSRSFQKDGAWIRGKTFYGDELPALIEVSARIQGWIERRKRGTQAELNLAAA